MNKLYFTKTEIINESTQYNLKIWNTDTYFPLSQEQWLNSEKFKVQFKDL